MDLGGDNSSNSSEELCHSTLNSNSTFIRNVDFWGDGVFTFVCGLIGVIGNFMTIIIFRYFENLKLGCLNSYVVGMSIETLFDM